MVVLVGEVVEAQGAWWWQGLHRKDLFSLPLVTPVALISRISTGDQFRQMAAWLMVCHPYLGLMLV